MPRTIIALALIMAVVLAACGGSDSPHFSSQITFGDSLSDVGSYDVGTVASIGGGKFTINGDNTAIDPALTGKIWPELIAAQLGLAAPCASQTGLDGDPSKGFSVPIVDHAGCFDYAMGGSRVSHPIGPENKLTGSPIGALTVPVATQIANHLAISGGRFSGVEVVFVMAGGNDVLSLLGQLSAAATAAGVAAASQAFNSSLINQLAAGATDPAAAAQAIGLALQTESARPGHTTNSVVSAAVSAAASQPGNAAVAAPTVYGPMVAKAQADGAAAGAAAGAAYMSANGPASVAAMGTAGTELANLVKDQIVGNGANFVVVNNLPDVSITPSAKAQSADTQALINAMSRAFNDALKAGIGSEEKVLYVDLFAQSDRQSVDPAAYGLTNATAPACGTNALGTSSLRCNGSNLVAGDVSHYLFADGVHPTPFAHSLIAKYVAEQMTAKGWL